MAVNKTLSPVSDIHMRNGLLTPISTKNNILLDLRFFSFRCCFCTSCEIPECVETKLNAEMFMSYKNKGHKLRAECTRFKYDCASIKFNQKGNNNPVLVIEIIELLRILGLSYDDGRLLVFDIGVHYRTRQRDIISIDAFTY